MYEYLQGKQVYIKFGQFHGLKGTIKEVIIQQEPYPATMFVISVPLPDGTTGEVIKKPSNTVMVNL